MAFGFSIGDFLAVPAFAYRVYKLCKDSNAEFQDVSGLVISLHCVLKEVAKFSVDLDPDQQEQLLIIGSRCRGVLLELERLLVKYATLSTKKYRIWDKLRWGLEDVKAIKGRLIENTILLNSLNTTFINSSQGRVEVKLDRYTAEVRAGKRNGSVLACGSVESLVSHDGQAWLKLRKELEALGISAPILEQHQQFIIAWFDEAVSAGALKEGCNVVKDDQGAWAQRSASHTTENTGLTGGTAVAEWAEAERLRLGSFTRTSSPDEYDRSRKQDKLDECLHLAMKDRNTAWVGELLDSGADPNCCDQTGRTVLQIAFDSNDVEIMALLLDNGADSKVLPFEHTTLFHQAVSGGHIKVLQLLLSYGADIDTRGIDGGQSALHIAASTGDRTTVQLLVDTGADLEATDDQNQTALYAAVNSRKKEVVQLLLDSGIAVNPRERVKQTALHAAASAGDEAIMQLLLDKGSNIEATDSWEQTALHVAVAYRRKAVVQLLLDRGADLAARNVARCTALHIASDGSYESNGLTINQREAIINLLLDKGADVESGDKKGNTALHYAALEGNLRILQLLLDRGADLEAKCGDGKTALHNAAHRLRLEAVKLLLDRGADFKVKDVFGRGAADYVVATPRDSAETRATKAAIAQVLNAAMEGAAGSDLEPLPLKTDGCYKDPVVCAAEITNSECIALAYWPTGLGM